MSWLKKSFRIFAFFLIFFTSGAHAGNEHEHLQYLPSYDDIAKAANGKLGEMPTKNLFKEAYDAGRLMLGERWISQLFPNEAHPSRAFHELVESTTYDQFASRVAKAHPGGKISAEQVKRMFFETSKLAPEVDTYLFSGSVRNALFEGQSDLLIRSLENHIDRLPKSELNKIVASIPISIETREHLEKLKALFQRKGVQAQLYSSIPRTKLIQENYPLVERLSNIKGWVDQGLLSGVDISGSIMESKLLEKSGAKIRDYDKGFHDVMQFSGENHVPLRIHAFEGASEGPFYVSFWKVLEDCKSHDCLPETVRIGHIQALHKEEILKLKSYSGKTHFVFEANIESNMKIQSADLKSLETNIESIHAQGMQVVLGADGYGILGNTASFEQSLSKLKEAGLPKQSLERLIKDAFIPITGTRVDKTTLLEWQIERVRVRSKLLGSDYRAIGGSASGACGVGQFGNFLRSIMAKQAIAH